MLGFGVQRHQICLCWALGAQPNPAESVGDLCSSGPACLGWISTRELGVKVSKQPSNPPGLLAVYPQPTLVGTSQERSKRGLGPLVLQPCLAVSEHAIE